MRKADKSRSGIYPHLFALLGLALLVAAQAWPLLSGLRSAIAGWPDFADTTEYVWNTYWVRRALTGPEHLWHTDTLFVPFGADLRFNVFGLLQSLLAYPFIASLGVVGAYNLILIVTFFLNGAVTYALFQREAQHPPAAFVAAAAFMLGQPLLYQILAGRSALGAAWIVSGALLAWISLIDRPRLWKGLVLGLLLDAALFTDFQVLLFSAMWLAVYGAYRLRRQGQALLDRSLFTAVALAAAMPLLPFLLIYYPALSSAAAAGFPEPRLIDMLPYSFQIEHYLNPAYWFYVAGYELVGGALLGVLIFRGRGPYRIWLAGAAVFLLFALGPYLQPARVPLPFAAFYAWPPLRQFRTPFRLAIPAMIGLGMVLSLVLARLFRRIRKVRIVYLVAGALVIARLVLAFILTPFLVRIYPEYDFYRQIAGDSGSYTILEVPFGVRSGLERIGDGGEVFQYYQPVHGKPLVGGSMARLPSRVFAFYRSYPSLVFLSGEPASEPLDQLIADFSEVLDWSGAGYVLLHRAFFSSAQAAQVEAFLNHHPHLIREGVEGDVVIYRVSD